MTEQKGRGTISVCVRSMCSTQKRGCSDVVGPQTIFDGLDCGHSLQQPAAVAASAKPGGGGELQHDSGCQRIAGKTFSAAQQKSSNGMFPKQEPLGPWQNRARAWRAAPTAQAPSETRAERSRDPETANQTVSRGEDHRPEPVCHQEQLRVPDAQLVLTDSCTHTHTHPCWKPHTHICCSGRTAINALVRLTALRTASPWTCLTAPADALLWII